MLKKTGRVFHRIYKLLLPKKMLHKNNSLYKSVTLSSYWKNHFNHADNRSEQEPLETELIRIINNKLITTVFQPIVCLKTGETIAFEALSRGPNNSPLYTPSKLFNCAAKYNKLYALETLCRETALLSAAAHGLKHTLFINIDPNALKDPAFKTGMTKHMLLELNQNPEQLVFEITERSAITDFSTFRHSINHYRRQGFTIAIDDAGAGYSSLQSIAELHPDYIKIDRSLIENIHQNPLKTALMEAMIKFAHSVKAKVIAEGIETKAELEQLMKLNVDFGQGYLLSYPNLPPPVLDEDLTKYIQELNAKQSLQQTLANHYGVTIGDIVENSPTVLKSSLVCDIETLFHDEHIHGITIVQNHKPIGLLMKNKLYYQLGTNYGVSLYYRRPVEKVMDKSPLIVNADLPLEAVSKMAMDRAESCLYDLIIVVRDNQYWGIVSIMNLLKNLTNIQIRCAYNSNPLTGLPGNIMIEERLKELVREQSLFALLYIDLDNFKAFNDKYGFEHGDKALLITTSILSSCLAKYSHPHDRDFLGHIGGDDFIIITHPKNVEKLCQGIICTFDHEIRSVYESKDLENGYIVVMNRKGYLEQFPIMTLSIAVVTNQYKQFSNYLEITETAAEIKKKAKSYNQSVWCIDERIELTPNR